MQDAQPMLEPKHRALLDVAAGRGLPSADGIGLCFQLLSLAAAIDRDCAARLAPRGLSEGKFVLLFLLHEQADGMAPHELAEGAGVTRATVTGLLDGLERDGFLSRQAGKDDRRKIRVKLTAKGRTAAARLFQEHTDWIGSLFAGLTIRTGAAARAAGAYLARHRRAAAPPPGDAIMSKARPPAPKPAGRGVKDIAGERLAQLNAGEPASTLTECLAVDFAALLQAAARGRRRRRAAMRAQAALGISRRMALAAHLLDERLGPEGFEMLKAHRSDTVRGWACFPWRARRRRRRWTSAWRGYVRWPTTRISACANGPGSPSAPGWPPTWTRRCGCCGRGRRNLPSGCGGSPAKHCVRAVSGARISPR